MHELLPGLFHWTAHHERIGMDVSSYFLAGETLTLLDPMPPPEGVEAVGRPAAIVLTTRHHLRHAERFAAEFGCPILCHEDGLHEFADGGPNVTGFRFGDELRPGLEALEMDAISPDDTALHVAAGDGALAFADAIIRYGGEIGFVPDHLIGDDPEGVKRRVREALEPMLERDFDTLLFAHGDPLVGGGRQALERFVAG